MIYYGLRDWFNAYVYALSYITQAILIIVTYYLSSDPAQQSTIIYFAISFESYMSLVLQQICQIEIDMIYFERCHNLITKVPAEQLELQSRGGSLGSDQSQEMAASRDNIRDELSHKLDLPVAEFRNASFRYHANMQNVLSDLNI